MISFTLIIKQLIRNYMPLSWVNYSAAPVGGIMAWKLLRAVSFVYTGHTIVLHLQHQKTVTINNNSNETVCNVL